MKRIRSRPLSVGAFLACLALVLTWRAFGQSVSSPFGQPNPPGHPAYPSSAAAPANNFGASPYSAGVVGTRPDPELQKLHDGEITAEREVTELLHEYSAATEDQRGKVRSRLSAALEKQFDLQQKRRELEVARVEAELKRLRELMKKRGDARQTIVEKRLDQLVREAEGLGWTTPETSRSSQLLQRSGYATPIGRSP